MQNAVAVVVQDKDQALAQTVLSTIASEGWDQFTEAAAASNVMQTFYRPCTIKTDKDLLIAQGQLTNVNALVKQIETSRKIMTKPLDAVKAYLIRMERLYTTPLQGFAENIKKEQLVYHNIQKAKAAEDERKKQEEIAENERLQQAARASLIDPDDPRTQVGTGLTGQDLFEMMNQRLDQEFSLTPPVPSLAIVPEMAFTSAPVVATVSTLTTYDVEVTDKKKVLAFIMANPELLACLDVNEQEIKRLARASKGAFVIDGVTITKGETVRS